MDITQFTKKDFGPRVKTLHTSPSSDVYIAQSRDQGEVVIKRTKITDPKDIKRFDKELEFLHACEHASVIAPLGVLNKFFAEIFVRFGKIWEC